MEFIFPVYLNYKDNIFTVLGYIGECEDYIVNKGYINPDDKIIYIYSNNKMKSTSIPYFWVNDDNDFEYNKLNPLMDKNFAIDNIVEWSFDEIVENTDENEELYNEEAINDMNAATNVFVPIINEDDDFLKKLIKQTIIDKNIDIKRLQHKLNKKYGLTNMKSALIGKTKMSVPNFIIWAELLGIDWEITVFDNGTDKLSPLNKSLTYESGNNKITK